LASASIYCRPGHVATAIVMDRYSRIRCDQVAVRSYDGHREFRAGDSCSHGDGVADVVAQCANTTARTALITRSISEFVMLGDNGKLDVSRPIRIATGQSSAFQPKVS